MNLVARLILETAGFVGPAQRALDPLKRVKAELAAVGREAERVGASSGGGASGGRLALPTASAGLAASAAPAALALAAVRAQTRAAGNDFRLALTPLMEFRAQLATLHRETRARPLINVTGSAGRLALGGGAGGGVGGVPPIIPPGAAGGPREVGSSLSFLRGEIVRTVGPLALLYGTFRAGAFAIKSASRLEDLTASFATLLGGVDKAKARMGELAKFAAETPFELPEVASASRVLETLTKGALSTGAGLRMVGDVAANTGQPFSELAMWIGRTYDGLQNGRPVGEALMRLQELGIMSGDTRTRIEALQEQGKRGNEVWAVAAASFARFSGEMDRRSATLSGQFSNLKDSAAAFAGALAGPALPAMTESLRGMVDVLETMTPALKENAGWMKELANIALHPATADIILAGQARKGARGEVKPPSPPQRAANDFTGDVKPITQFFDSLDRLSTARASIKDTVDAFRDVATQRVLNDPFSSHADRTQALDAAGRRAFESSGIASAPDADPQGVDQALARVQAEIELVHEMSTHNELAEEASAKMAKLGEAYEKLVGLSTQLNAIRKNAVDERLHEFFDSMDKPKEAHLGGGAAPASDALARIGGLIGGGGPALDFARRTADATMRTVAILQNIAQRPANDAGAWA